MNEWLPETSAEESPFFGLDRTFWPPPWISGDDFRFRAFTLSDLFKSEAMAICGGGGES
jgi:hypothetical protein